VSGATGEAIEATDARHGERVVEATPRLLLFTRDDPARATGGVETFGAQLLALFPGSDAVAYAGAAGPRRLLDEARDARAARGRLLERIAAVKPAAVVANGAAAWALPRLAVPCITVYHGTYAGFGRAIARATPWRGAIARSYGAWMERRAARHAAAVVAVSASVAEQARRHYGVTQRLVVIENAVAARAGVPPTRGEARTALALPTTTPLLLFVGRGDATKGFDAFVELARRRPEWNFAAAGVDAPRDGSRALPRNLRPLGTLAAAPLQTWRAAADAVVLPTCYEGCSFALIEALAADRPIVTTATGAFPDAGRFPYGIVVERRAARDDGRFIAALDAAIAAIVAEPTAFAPRAATAARFSFDRFARGWRALVAEVAGRGR